jgi:hypothetical protein
MRILLALSAELPAEVDVYLIRVSSVRSNQILPSLLRAKLEVSGLKGFHVRSFGESCIIRPLLGGSSDKLFLNLD